MDGGLIQTDGSSSIGLLAQSIGGGGGSVGCQSSLVTLGGESGGGGDGGSVSVSFSGGTIKTGTIRATLFQAGLQYKVLVAVADLEEQMVGLSQ